MGKLIYSAITSLDGYIEDHDGNFDWAKPSEELFGFLNDLERPVGTYLYGRRMYETMLYWETVQLSDDSTAAERDFTLIWRSAEKVVYSRTLDSVSSAKTRIEREFVAGAIQRLKANSGLDLSIGGSGLAARAFADGLVDELQLFVVPVVVGGGKNSLPTGVRAGLKLLNTHTFDSGSVYLRYQFKS